MKIIIKATNLDLSLSLREYIQKKIKPLEKFLEFLYNKANSFNKRGKNKVEVWVEKVEVWVEIEKTTSHHRKGPIFRAECQIKLPRKSVRATAQSKDLRASIDEIKDKLQRQLKAYKEKLIAEAEKGAIGFKDELKVSSQAKYKKENRF